MESQTLHQLFKDAVTALTQGNPGDVRDLLGAPYQDALARESSKAVKQQAATLHRNLWDASSDIIHPRLPLDKVKVSVLNQFKATNNSVERQFMQSSNSLHKFLHDVSKARMEQADVLTQHESELYKELSGNGILGNIEGAVRYNIDLVKRRWGADHRAGAEVIIDHVQDAASEITEAPAQGSIIDLSSGGLSDSLLNSSDSSSLLNSNGIDAILNAGKSGSPAHQPLGQPTASVSNPTLEGTALEEFGGIKQLNTPLRKAGALALGGLGAGLVVHGARNAYCAFKPEASNHLLLDSAEKPQESKVNWTQLAVGTSEAILGGALIYRSATGRWSTGAVQGHATPLFECTHGI